MSAPRSSGLFSLATLLVLFSAACAQLTGAEISALYEPPADYYASCEGLIGPSLKAALHQTIRNHSVLPYGSSGTVPALRVLDAMPGDSSQVRLLYWGTGRSVSSYGGSNGQWNHEHCWPQSYGVKSGPGNSDLFNLRPCDVQANAERGNSYFSEISGGTVPLYAPLCRKNSPQWMPRTEEKGDLARAMFYMAVRYEGGEATPDLELSETPNTSAYRFGKLSDLLAWHRLDPVDDEERLRNHRIYSAYQFNRNPFVDDPDYAEMVFLDLPVVHLAVLRHIATEGGVGNDAAAIIISRRGPTAGPLDILLEYGGPSGSAPLESPPTSVSIAQGSASVTVHLCAAPNLGLQGERAFSVALAVSPSYVLVDPPVSLAVADAPDDPLASWANGYGLQGGAADADADPDSDGWPNLLEYALSGSPTNPLVGGEAHAFYGIAGALAIVAVIRTNDPRLSVVGEAVSALGDYADPSLVKPVDGSADQVDQAGLPGGFQRQVFTVPIGTDPDKFLRLKAALMP